MKNIGIIYALIAATLFGCSIPIAKMFLAQANPWLMAGTLYMGSGVGLSILFFGSFLRKKDERNLLKKSDWPLLMLATVFGGILGPAALMAGLQTTSAASSSLLMNLEAVLTSLIAWGVFKEHVDRRIFIGMVFILAGSVVVNWSGMPEWQSVQGPMLIAAACLCWSIDNNLTRKISKSNPMQSAMIKSLVSGSFNIVLAKALGVPFLNMPTFLEVGLIGFVGYGLSLIFFIMALRHVGAARTGAYFSMAPFAGSMLAVCLNPNEFSLKLVFAAALMAIGIGIHVLEQRRAI